MYYRHTLDPFQIFTTLSFPAAGKDRQYAPESYSLTTTPGTIEAAAAKDMVHCPQVFLLF
ncbi:MAG: hypothetical protein R3297_07980 [Desulfobulbales bacterium]|nr:hypothetical protein [Desulfobulbales bacterium]